MWRGSCRRRRGLLTAAAPRRPACVLRSASAARVQRERSAPAHEYADTPKPVARAAELGAAAAALTAPLNGARDKPPAPPARWPPRARTS